MYRVYKLSQVFLGYKLIYRYIISWRVNVYAKVFIVHNYRDSSY